ncbi:MAG: MFS transporter [Gammaproteobacteria bacterium]|nr:MAG: MFS transporter [Gammaproteobacteria bacterium]
MREILRERSLARPLHYYLVGTGSWFLAYGIQSVMFAWLVTMVLRESPERVGFAQMALLLPGTLLILIGGSYADRYGGRKVVILAQSFAVLASAYLLFIVGADRLTYPLIIAYALLMGLAQAFVTPARDGLLNEVAEGRLQRTVMLTSIIQFGLQMVGFLVASLSDRVGPELVIGTQMLALLIGVLGFARISTVARSAPTVQPRLLRSVVEGAKTVFGSPSMRMVMIQNVAMALFFMGSYIVTMPILVREVFSGTAQDLAFMNGANSLGLVSTILLLLRLGDVQRQGRALLLAESLGARVLAGAAVAPSSVLWGVASGGWGVCGGAAMTMSRTIMQEQAPEAQRGRVMSFYSFSFMGAGPVGALICGYLVELFGPQLALMTAAGCMLAVILVVWAGSSLWRLEGHTHQALQEVQGEAADGV